MKVSELIELLKQFPQDVEVSADNGQGFLALLLPGGVVLEKAGSSSPFYGDYRSINGDKGSSLYEGPHVSIVGGNETHHGTVE